MPRALLTGAAGFLGGNLLRSLLVRGWEVHALLGATCREAALEDVRERITIHHHDGSTDGMLGLVGKAQPDVVFHLASVFLADHQPAQIEGLMASNLTFSTQLAEAVVACGGGRLVNTGTSWQYARGEGYLPLNLYAATKQACEDILTYYHDARGLSCITLKLFDTYGTGDPRRKLVSLLLEAARSGGPIALSPGEQTLDLLHMDDVAAAFRIAGECLLAAPEPLLASHLLGGTRLTVRALAECITQVTGCPIQAQWGGRPYRPREIMVPVSPGPDLPGWAPQVSLEEGLGAVFRALALT